MKKIQLASFMLMYNSIVRLKFLFLVNLYHFFVTENIFYLYESTYYLNLFEFIEIIFV